MDGLDRVTLGVRRKFGQKLQGEKFDTLYLVGYLFSAYLHKKFQLSVSIALREPERGVYSVGGCTTV